MRIRNASAAVALVVIAAVALYPGNATAARNAVARTIPAASVSAINWGRPVFTDNFNGTELSTSWTVYNDPGAMTPKPKRTPDSVQVRNGSLQLTGHYEKHYGYVGGGVAYRTNQTYGRWEIRFRADAGAGYAPVILLWPQSNWPTNGEIDLAEVTNPQRHGAGEFLHLGITNRFIGKHILPAVDFTKWHTIAVDWLPDHVTFWLDGKALWTVRRAAGNSDYVPSTPFHLALQNDAGCDAGCKPDTSTPANVVMDIDWVKIYAAPVSAPDAPPGATATAYSPDGSYLATADGNGHVYIWNLPGYKLKETLTDPASKGVPSLAFTSKSHYLAAADGNGHVYIWAIATGQLNATVADPGSKGVRGVAYSPDGRSMSTADANGHIYIWAEPDYTLTATLTNPPDA
jgi:beta-glucanase (GH16 family)